ncbi:hypothetical protein [Iningainema tapete]|uniref:Lipoprotein n=1 Tax=Iningainema tapete BLCC-T55 TaxID=2748662 RepID=A0A8J6XKI5_9CYAN|nr:hypothetical protein [Iningainema tapete]MBD2778595.1 hypothetical protein [Iningainema tapete BLCC-T55]
MFVSHKYIVINLVSISVAVTLAACSESKVSQCERLIQAVNKGTGLIDKSKGNQVTTSLKLAQDLQAVTKEIKEMNLKDPKLQEFQTSFVKVFEIFNQSIAEAAKALNSTKTADSSSNVGKAAIQKARGDIDTTLTKAQTAAKQSDKLASGMNNYCKQQ